MDRLTVLENRLDKVKALLRTMEAQRDAAQGHERRMCTREVGARQVMVRQVEKSLEAERRRMGQEPPIPIRRPTSEDYRELIK